MPIDSMPIPFSAKVYRPKESHRELTYLKNGTMVYSGLEIQESVFGI